MDLFMEALPQGAEVCVPRVSVGGVSGNGEGRYQRLDRSVRVEPLDADTLTTHLWHELCHAADFQLGLNSHEDDIWLFEDPGLAPDVRSDRTLAREAFATVCGLGPEAFSLMDQACNADSTLTRATTGFLADVYGGAEARPALTPLGGASTTLPEGFALTAVSARTPTTWVLWLEDEAGEVELLWVDRETGLPAEPTDDELGGVEPMAVTAPPGWATMEEVPVAGVGVVRLRLDAVNGATAERLWVDGSLGCTQQDEILIGVDDEVWGVVATGLEVAWHRWASE